MINDVDEKISRDSLSTQLVLTCAIFSIIILVFEIVSGCVYLNKTSRDDLPLWLLTHGCLKLVFTIIKTGKHDCRFGYFRITCFIAAFFILAIQHSTSQKLPEPFNFAFMVFSFFILGWFIKGQLLDRAA